MFPTLIFVIRDNVLTIMTLQIAIETAGAQEISRCASDPTSVHLSGFSVDPKCRPS